MRHHKKRMLHSIAALVTGCTLAWMIPNPSRAQVSPFDLVSNLDLSCHLVRGGVTPVQALRIRHFNPVLRAKGLSEETAYLGQLEQLCAPVAKNKVIPPSPAIEILRWVDLACYQAKSEKPVNLELELFQLNPVLREMGVPPLPVYITRLEQLCVPVAKDGVIPPRDVIPIVEHVDVACYRIEKAGQSDPFRLHLTDLNPVLVSKGISEQDVDVGVPAQLCVPVLKNDLVPPREVLRLIEWIDLLKYEVKPLPVTLTLQHLNPLFRDLKPFGIELLEVEQLGVPVAKNQQYPPYQQ